METTLIYEYEGIREVMYVPDDKRLYAGNLQVFPQFENQVEGRY